MKLTIKFYQNVIIRMVADLIILTLAFVSAFILRFLALMLIKKISISQSNIIFNDSVKLFIKYFWLVVLINLIIFFINGFYTHGRAYKGRYKALMIFQSVTIGYLLFGFISYYYPFSLKLPRSIWFAGWLTTLILIYGIRKFAELYRNIVWKEAKIVGKPTNKSIQNVTVIGGAGYIGSVLVKKLLDAGYNVTILDAFLYGKESIYDLKSKKGFQAIEGDIRRVEDVVRALELTDAVIHLAAIVGDPACSVNERLTLEINLAATRLITEVAKGFGVKRLIFASTCSVYGASHMTLDENSIVNPLSSYAKTKLASENLILNFCSDSIASTVLRFSTVYGLSPRPRFDLVINTLTAKAVKEGHITIFGGDQWRPFIHVDDVAFAIMKVLEAPEWLIKGKIYNVGSDDQNYKLSEIGEIIKNIIPKTEITKEIENLDSRNYRVSFSKIRKELGFSCIHTIRDGVLEIKEFVEKNNIDYKDEKYNNYLKFKKLNSNNLIETDVINNIFLRDLE